MRRAKRLRRARDRCLLAVACSVAFLKTVMAAHLGTVNHKIVRGLTVMAGPYLPEGRALHAEVIIFDPFEFKQPFSFLIRGDHPGAHFLSTHWPWPIKKLIFSFTRAARANPEA